MSYFHSQKVKTNRMNFTLYKVTEQHKPTIPNNTIVALYTGTTGDPRLPEHINNTFGRDIVSIGKEHKPTLLTHNNGTLTHTNDDGTETTIGTLKIVQEPHKWYQIYLTPAVPYEHLTVPIIQTLIFPTTNPEEADQALTEDYKQRVTNNRIRHWNATRAHLEDAGAAPQPLSEAETLITSGIWEPGTREKVTNLINEACTTGINTINAQYTNTTEQLHQKGLI